MPAFAKEFDVFVSALSADASKKVAAAARAGAIEIPARQRSRRGDAPGVTSAVDGDLNKSFEAVRPDGKIVLLFDYRAEIVHACLQELVARAPVLTGTYRRSFTVLLDGEGLPPMTVPSPEQLKTVQQIVVVNPLPYAMRLETGVTKSGRAFVRQTEPHIVEGAMQPVRREFSAVAKISYRVIDLNNAYERKSNFASRLKRHRHRGIGSKIQYPAIVIDRL